MEKEDTQGHTFIIYTSYYHPVHEEGDDVEYERHMTCDSVTTSFIRYPYGRKKDHENGEREFHL